LYVKGGFSMREQVTVIDITAQVTDNTASGAAGAERNVSRLEQTMMRVQQSIQRMQGMSRIEMTANLVDNASRGISNILQKGGSLAGKVWTVTMKAVDFITAPARGVINLLKNPIFQAAGIVGVGLGTADAIRSYTGFQQSMTDIRAISDMTRREMDMLGDSFRGLAGDFSATEIAGAAKNFVTIGRSADEILAKLPYAMTLSAASGMEL
jgi:hypothetical protein